MASDIRSLIKEIEYELAQAEYQAAQWRGLSTALVLQDAFRENREVGYPVFVTSSTLDEIKSWNIDAEQSADGEVVITLTEANRDT